MELTVGGRSQEFQDLYEREFETVFRACLLVAGNPTEAEDAVQEAFARALVRWNRLADRPYIVGWIVTTAVNIARRALRKTKKSEASSRESLNPDVEAAIDVRQAIRSLPARQAQAVILHYLLDLPLREVAYSMNCSEGAVKAHLSRARGKLVVLIGGVTEE